MKPPYYFASRATILLKVSPRGKFFELIVLLLSMETQGVGLRTGA
jgi:hypothetical protein